MWIPWWVYVEKVRPTLSNPYHVRPLPSSRLKWFSDFVRTCALVHLSTTENACPLVHLSTCSLTHSTTVVPTYALVNLFTCSYK